MNAPLVTGILISMESLGLAGLRSDGLQVCQINEALIIISSEIGLESELYTHGDRVFDIGHRV